ncbi:restriction endonuclease [Amycolatopsis balhimycina]|uniref:restriction endonuclease n=1 Tax=Amycolatopsis balhimycina TaxID=208443 RepID=UPI000688BF98|nr:restriction endonuclease [Amycolatopsis balhimycina]
MADKLVELRQDFITITGQEAQRRGYSLEKFLNELFALYDIDAKGSFRVYGEQIDGAFTFQGVEYLLEAKWHKDLTPLADLDVFSGKVNRKLDNTLGLFVSMMGFQPSAIELATDGQRPALLLMDGSDLMMALDGRIAFPELLKRKRQHAAQNGDVFLRATQILSE